ncbi:MAG: carbamoyltransferase HypF [Coriobacteriaceae bacterium]|nr:carbamoyltransferase HypF [Coriobacteriaceae bacterium]
MRIHITGVVQGVGMRPFVYREAISHGVSGWVLNAGDGVHIEARAEEDALDAFVRSLRAHAPAAAQIDSIDVTPLDEAGAHGDISPDASATLDAPNPHEASSAAPATAPAARTPGAPTSRTATSEPSPRFRIIPSQDETEHSTLVSPDIATCDDCLRELFDPADRRFHYPFTNCTNCGPRFTIIRDLPYDRAQTSMSAFPLCATCADEYADPLDRRFHAQPNACFACGPHLTWRERESREQLTGATRETSDAIIERCVRLIATGGIVVIKGLGGFHLTCRADSEDAVQKLRVRKRRSNKPLAVMVRNINAAEMLCHIGPEERALLEGSIRPIVLLRRRQEQQVAVFGHSDAKLSPECPKPTVDTPGTPAHASAGDIKDLRIAHAVAYDLPELGVMLPYTPLQHLLLAACQALGIDALVMTSGNVSGAPIEMDDDLAWRRLVEAGIADALLGNNRAILSRFDDSVVRVIAGRTQIVRRARGYAPKPIELPPAASPTHTEHCILACGPEQKATLALTREQENGTALGFVSQHIGDLENAETFDAWRSALTRAEELFALTPTALACDAHPGYLSSQWARERARATGLPLVKVQHHHAHIAAVIAEAAARQEIDVEAQVVGIAFDGTGAGATMPAGRSERGDLELDGTIWGGEFLLATLSSFERVAHLEPWPLPGGAASVRDPRRNAFSLLRHYGLLDHPGAALLLASLSPRERAFTERMTERNINCPATSSMGRLLDAVSAILGICASATYEGEPAILLEAAALRYARARGEGAAPSSKNAVYAPCAPKAHAPNSPAVNAISARPLLSELLDGIARGDSTEKLAWAAHRSIIDLTVRATRGLARATGVCIVALSGGVFMNRLLFEGISTELEGVGFTVLTPHEPPCNDGCIAFGQAAVARAQLAAASRCPGPH